MSARWQVVRARAGRTCTECRRVCIHPGDLYLVASVPPNHEFNGTGAWRRIGACLDCADPMHTEATRAQLAARRDREGTRR